MFDLAYAMGTGGSGGGQSGGLGVFLPLIIIFAIFYFLLIAPERKQRKKRQAMLDQLKKGDEVLTTGGIIGKVIEVRDERVVLQVADNTRLTFSRQAVQTVVLVDAEKGGDKAREPEKPKKA